MEPLSKESVKSSKPAMFALEVNKGWFKNNNVKVGDLIKVQDSNKLVRISVVRQKNSGKNSRGDRS